MALQLLGFIDRLNPIQRLGLNTIEGAVRSGLGVASIKQVFRAAGFSMGNERIEAVVRYYRDAGFKTAAINRRGINFKPRRADIPTWWGEQDKKYRYVVGINGFDGPLGRGHLDYITIDSRRILSRGEILADAREILKGESGPAEDEIIELEVVDEWKLKP